MKMNTSSRELLDRHQPGWLDSFQDQVANLWEKWPKANVFALLDCVFTDQCHVAIKKHRLPSRSLYDLSNDPSPELQAVSPTLVPLTTANISAWREVLRITDGMPMLSMITTPESIDALAQRLHPWCIVNADGEHYVFRFPDTRRLPGVVRVMTPQQHGAFFGPAYAWHHRTRSAQWAELPLPETSFSPADTVKLNAEQFAQLIADSEADAIISHLHTYEPALIQPYRPALAHDLIAQGLKRADHYGIENRNHVDWCGLFLKQPEMECMPKAAPLLTSLKAKECCFDDIREALDELVKTA